MSDRILQLLNIDIVEIFLTFFQVCLYKFQKYYQFFWNFLCILPAGTEINNASSIFQRSFIRFFTDNVRFPIVISPISRGIL